MRIRSHLKNSPTTHMHQSVRAVRAYHGFVFLDVEIPLAQEMSSFLNVGVTFFSRQAGLGCEPLLSALLWGELQGHFQRVGTACSSPRLRLWLWLFQVTIRVHILSGEDRGRKAKSAFISQLLTIQQRRLKDGDNGSVVFSSCYCLPLCSSFH